MVSVLQQLLTIALLLIATVAWVTLGAAAPFLALLLSIAGPISYAGVLVVEFALCATVDRTGKPDIRWSVWCRAWLAEIAIAPVVFCWRQPFRLNAQPDMLNKNIGGDRRGVVLVHGLFCNRAFWTPWIRRLNSDGRCFVAVNLEPVFGSIDNYLAQIDVAVNKVRAATGLPVLIICHSMGGLAVRKWLVDIPDYRVAHRVVTIATPHNGTWLARFGYGRNTREMRQDSPWITKLNQLSSVDISRRFICWYSDTDNVVFPAANACLSGADNRLVTGVSHVCLAFTPCVMDQTLALLD